jgi:hypothetical protein
MSLAFRCEVCGGHDRGAGRDPRWVIERHGDAVVTWSCDAHLAEICLALQRAWERTELSVRLARLT